MSDEPVDDQRPSQSVCVLSAIMRVIPAGSECAGPERVRKRGPRCNGALLNGRHSIRPLCLFLEKAMPMDRGSLPVDVIINSDLDRVAPIDIDCWPGYLIIDHDDTSVEAVRGLESSSNIESIILGVIRCWAIFIRVGVVQGRVTPWIAIDSWLGRIDDQCSSSRTQHGTYSVVHSHVLERQNGRIECTKIRVA